MEKADDLFLTRRRECGRHCEAPARRISAKRFIRYIRVEAFRLQLTWRMLARATVVLTILGVSHLPAQTAAISAKTNVLFTPGDNLFPSPVWTGAAAKSLNRDTSGRHKHLTIESFGYDLSAQAPGFDTSPGYTAALFDAHGLECPGCVLGPRNRTRFTLPPFGANAVLKLNNGRVEVFSGFGALEAWKADGTFERQGFRLASNAEGDAWLAQIQAGFRIAVDHGQHLWMGATGRHLYNLGPGLKQWNTLSGDVTLRLDRAR